MKATKGSHAHGEEKHTEGGEKVNDVMWPRDPVTKQQLVPDLLSEEELRQQEAAFTIPTPTAGSATELPSERWENLTEHDEEKLEMEGGEEQRSAREGSDRSSEARQPHDILLFRRAVDQVDSSLE
ncbi:hypothetical protein KP509_30G020300 [Ceratopteris richardii]|uniref:Uncharacterized protein n=1 Tax=Ceratopteris richardii TaxID=49495 RepID=A0A8T2R0F7_CERRI|nr:hypothetical protein KP509_30G020300 [Ceratopteris richardii]